jgi:hypothetical protein
MVGAALEAVLTSVTAFLYEDALKTGEAPKYGRRDKRKGETKDLLEWSFYELLAVAKKANWIPGELELEQSLDPRTVKNPVPTDSIRKLRNLVHPARYLQDRAGKEYTPEDLRVLYATCHAAYGFVQQSLIKHIQQSHPDYKPPAEYQSPVRHHLPPILWP